LPFARLFSTPKTDKNVGFARATFGVCGVVETVSLFNQVTMSNSAENPSTMKLREQSEHLCKNIMMNQVVSLQMSRDLRVSLIEQNIITALTTCAELKADGDKMKLRGSFIFYFSV